MNKSEFEVLSQIIKTNKHPYTQRDISKQTIISLGNINRIINKLKEKSFIDNMYNITLNGIKVMSQYKVDNAVIMAAGMSTRFAPLSYEMPKALLKVKGEILIEREIKQLQESGINDITVIVGYMKEKMYYLADKFNVNIVVNEDYYRYNNPSSLIMVLDKLKNTYICSSDNYFTENVFEPYVYRSYYSAVYADGKTDEYCLSTTNDGLIKNVTIGGQDSWYMLGHVYFDHAFSKKFVDILKSSYDQPGTKEQLWENLYMKNINQLPLYIRKYDSTMIKEFDSLDELRCFDDHYIDNADSNIFKNIQSVISCKDQDITNIVPIKTGLTNTSFKFSCNGKDYVYRHPGVGTEQYINRKSEAASMKIAKSLGLDNTFIYMDSHNGWKISHFVNNAKTLDYHNKAQVSNAINMIRILHTSNLSTSFHFDPWKQIDKFLKILATSGCANFEGMNEIQHNMNIIRQDVKRDNVSECLCHCDCYNPNFLIAENNEMYLIDWEYSGMADPAVDIGTFIACSDYSTDKAKKIITQYLAHKPAETELRHYLAYVAILSYYWFIWALYQDSVGKPVGEWQYLWFKYTKLYSKEAIEMYHTK